MSIQKRPSFRSIPPISLFFIFLALIGLSVFFSINKTFIGFRYEILAIFLLVVLLSNIYLSYRKKIGFLSVKKEEFQESRNLAAIENTRLITLKESLQKRIENYKYLEKFTERLNKETSFENICEAVVCETFSLFGSKGNVLLYIMGEKHRHLQLKAIKKEVQSQAVKEKTGDLFDEWCLRHRQPLLVEVAGSDFRFNPDRIRDEISRPVNSLICAPLVTESRLLGILRVDSALNDSYHSDDLRFLSIIADIAKLAIENAIYFNHMQALSVTDGLTGVYLRRYAMERLNEEFLRAQRENIPLCFIMLDIDYFKNFNDEFGHMGGDIVLKKIARWLKEFFDLPASLVFRYGGEEFGIILPHVQKKEALRLCESFRKYMKEKEIILRGKKVSITVSIGVAVFPDDVKLREDIIRCADDALLKAKRSGRDKTCHL